MSQINFSDFCHLLAILVNMQLFIQFFFLFHLTEIFFNQYFSLLLQRLTFSALSQINFPDFRHLLAACISQLLFVLNFFLFYQIERVSLNIFVYFFNVWHSLLCHKSIFRIFVICSQTVNLQLFIQNFCLFHLTEIFFINIFRYFSNV